jgi:succinate dehydrogenase/fumarate reductase flavoprotein subunit
MWERAGVDPFRDPMDWIPAPYPTLASGGGIHVGLFAETNLPGVYAAGDITCLPPHGTYSVGGLNLCFAAVSGLIAGEQSTVGDRLNNTPSITLAVEKAQKILQPLDQPEVISVSQVVVNIQNLVIPYHVGYLKSADTLKKAWAEAERIEKDDVDRLSARDGHTLIRALECRSMIRLAQAMIKASLFRTESRGFHFRKDFPLTDNVNWLKWVLVQRDHNITEAGGLILSTCDVPLPYYRPDTAEDKKK